MFRFVVSVLRWAGAFHRSRQDLALEILALRQQVLVLKGKNPRPPWGRFDRLFWVAVVRQNSIRLKPIDYLAYCLHTPTHDSDTGMAGNFGCCSL